MKLSLRKFGILGAVALVICALALAVPHTIRQDEVQMGKGNNSVDKELIFDTGDGANNKRLIIDGTTKDGSLNVDQLTLGDGTSSDKEVVFDAGLGAANPLFRWDDSEARLKFSNDGTLFENIGAGAGGGGGTNLLVDSNYNFETGSPPSSWTASGGTFTAETTNPGFGDQSGSWDSSAAAQTLDSVLVSVPKGLEGRQCAAVWQQKFASAALGDTKAQVLDSSANVLAEKDLGPSSNWIEEWLTFVCPVSDTVRIRFLSVVADPPVILLDEVHLGSNIKEVQVSQAGFYGEARYAATSLCTWSTTSGTYASFAADPQCPAPSLIGKAQAPGTKIPGVTFANLPPGRYVVRAHMPRDRHNNADTCGFRLTDGTTSSPASVLELSFNSDQSISTVQGVFEYTVGQGSTTFEVEGARLAGSTSTCEIHNDSFNEDFTIDVVRYPLEDDAANAYSLEQQGWHVDVTISGANPSLGTAAQASYVEITNGSLAMTLNGASQPAEIPCSSTNPSTGLTCAAGNEGLGAVFDIKKSGSYLACASFAHELNLNSSTNAASYFQLVETPNNAQTILQEGNSRLEHQFDTASFSQTQGVPIRVCGLFQFASAGQKTLRIMYEQGIAAGSILASTVMADQNGASGQRDVHIEVYPITNQWPMPVIIDSVMNPGSGAQLRQYSVLIDCDASPTFSEEQGDWISSVVHNGTGDCSINFNTGAFADPTTVHCQATEWNSGAGTNSSISIFQRGTSFVRLQAYQADTGAAKDDDYFLSCTGY